MLFGSDGTTIKVYPIPGSSVFTIEADAKDNGAVYAEVVDSVGRLVLTIGQVDGRMELGMEWAAGIYFI